MAAPLRYHRIVSQLSYQTWGRRCGLENQRLYAACGGHVNPHSKITPHKHNIAWENYEETCSITGSVWDMHRHEVERRKDPKKTFNVHIAKKVYWPTKRLHISTFSRHQGFGLEISCHCNLYYNQQIAHYMLCSTHAPTLLYTLVSSVSWDIGMNMTFSVQHGLTCHSVSLS